MNMSHENNQAQINSFKQHYFKIFKYTLRFAIFLCFISLFLVYKIKPENIFLFKIGLFYIIIHVCSFYIPTKTGAYDIMKSYSHYNVRKFINKIIVKRDELNKEIGVYDEYIKRKEEYMKCGYEYSVEDGIQRAKYDGYEYSVTDEILNKIDPSAKHQRYKSFDYFLLDDIDAVHLFYYFVACSIVMGIIGATAYYFIFDPNFLYKFSLWLWKKSM